MDAPRLPATLPAFVVLAAIGVMMLSQPDINHLSYGLKSSEASVTLQAKGEPLALFGQSDECFTCPLLPIGFDRTAKGTKESSTYDIFRKEHVANTIKNGTGTFQIDTQQAWRLMVNTTGGDQASLHYHFNEYGNYKLEADLSTHEISLTTLRHGSALNGQMPIVVAFLLLGILGMLANLPLATYIHRLSSPTTASDATESLLQKDSLPERAQQPDPVPPKKWRLQSLDTFRGSALTIMMFVNYGGGGYWFFNHSRWNGLTVADLVFPWFMWIMGTSLAFSFASQRKHGIPRRAVLQKVLRRSATLFCLGLFLNSRGLDPDDNGGGALKDLRILGVLQYFSVSYLIVASTVVFWEWPSTATSGSSSGGGSESGGGGAGNGSPFRDLTPFWGEWLVCLALLLVYLLLQFHLPVPGCPTGYLGPGGLAEGGRYFGRPCVGGAHRRVDVAIFGESHIYGSGTAHKLYITDTYDPEGTLGMLTAAVMTFLGLQAGRVLLVFKGDHRAILGRWTIWGTALCLIAGVLCGFKQNGGPIPVNKNMWSVSFIFTMAGSGFLMLSLCYVLVDQLKVWSGAPFRYVGMNSIAIYCCHETFSSFVPFHWPIPDTHSCQLASNMLAICLWISIAYYWHERGIFINV